MGRWQKPKPPKGPDDQPDLFENEGKLLPDVCRPYHKGDAMSEAANTSIHKHKTAIQTKCFADIDAQQYRGSTSDETEVRLDMRHQTVSAAFTELRAQGVIVRTGETRATRSGRQAHVVVTRQYLRFKGQVA
jgi:hypothetical protein